MHFSKVCKLSKFVKTIKFSKPAKKCYAANFARMAILARASPCSDRSSGRGAMGSACGASKSAGEVEVRRGGGRTPRQRVLRHLCESLGGGVKQRTDGKISAKCCSFSAVSAPIFARKYAFFSNFQNLPDDFLFLPDDLAEFSKNRQNLQLFATFAKFC